MALLAAPSTGRAITLNYCDFSSTAGLSVNYNASKQGKAINLTPNELWQRGSVWTTTSFPFDATTSFHTYFRFVISPNMAGADGLVFVLQSGSSVVGGGAGLGLGYSGIPSSVAVEFDTYDNGDDDPDANHVAILFDGDIAHHIATGTPPFLIAGPKEKYVWIDFDSADHTLEVFIAEEPQKPATPLISKFVDIDAHVGPNVRAGFTGATGGVSNIHSLIEWEMSTTGLPCCAVTPGGACAGALPACGPAGLCVECVSNADCSGNTSVCSGQTCVPCVDDADCAGAPGGPVCAPSGACVGCTSDAGCTAPFAKCLPATQTCVACVFDTDCGAAAPACEPTTHTCVGCYEDSICPALSICDLQASECVPGCHVIAGKDSCGPGMMCDRQDGMIGNCHVPGSSSSGMTSSSSSTSAGGGQGGAITGSGGGATSTGGAGGATSQGGAGGAHGGGGSTSGPGPVDTGCACDLAARPRHAATSLAGAALLLGVLGARRRRRSAVLPGAR